ncbi:hypothetical protein [Paenibacillus turpanensis]|uniref:hypothetical protein n=1 Tax=Paenibacillus turpanensis TaxID=2689078 RepID=UPI00140E67D6|nr:hypothetical protein [Paenibacillus turpanensis]
MKAMVWVLKITLGSIIVSVVSMATTLTVVNSYVEQWMKSMPFQASIRPVTFNDVLAGLTGGSLPSQNAAKTPSERVAEPALPTAAKPEAEWTGKGEGTTETWKDSESGSEQGLKPDQETKESPVERKKPPEDALAVMGRISSSDEASGSTERDVMVTTEEINQKKNSISDEDKMKIFSILVSKLPQNEWQTISSMMEDGLTGNELQEIQQIVQQYVTTEEYQELMKIIG